MDATDELTVGEVAKRSGFAPSAIRYYEDVGLIKSTRTTGGQRRFERSVLRRLAFIAAARHVGLTLDEIRDALAKLPENRKIGRASCRERGQRPADAAASPQEPTTTSHHP